MIHVAGKFNPGVLAIAGNYRTAEDLDNDPDLTRLRQQESGVVITLENSNLKFRSIAAYGNTLGQFFHEAR